MPTILVVDDEEVDRELATRCLRRVEDLAVVYAEDGARALEVIAGQKPDLVLTDLRMPGMDGLELVAKVRDEFPLVPVILMTSRGSEQIAVRALKAGAASYVPKRDLKRELVETIQQVLEVTAAGRSRQQVLRFLDRSETRFALDNDPALISPLVGYLRENLNRLGFGNEAVQTQVGMALMEAVSNAMIHGNLEIGSDLREGSTEDYYRMIQRRQQEKPYAARRVQCAARESIHQVEYTIRDEGPGFDPSSLPDPDSPESLVQVRGRGLFLIRTFMDAVDYNERGNQITMTKTKTDASSSR